jgi:hypothetical protein
MIGRSFEDYFRLLALSALTFELYLRRQLFRDGGFPRFTAAFHDLLWLSTTYCGYFTSSATRTDHNHHEPRLLNYNHNLPANYCSYFHDLLWLSAIYCGYFTLSVTRTNYNHYNSRFPLRAYDYDL